MQFLASNMTGRHRGPKQKLQAGYRVPSLQQTAHYTEPSLWWPSQRSSKRRHRGQLWRSSSVESYAFSALGAYSAFGHHPHSLGYCCAKFSFCCAPIAELARRQKLCTQSINHSVTHPAYLMPREPKLLFQNWYNLPQQHFWYWSNSSSSVHSQCVFYSLFHLLLHVQTKKYCVCCVFLYNNAHLHKINFWMFRMWLIMHASQLDSTRALRDQTVHLQLFININCWIDNTQISRYTSHRL